MAAPTVAGLERSIKRAFLERVRAVEIRPNWKQAAGIEWDSGSNRIGVLWVEPYQRGIGWAVIHELTHYCWNEEADRWGEFEEGRIESDANLVWKRIEQVPARYWWWRKTIAAKLKGGL